MLIVSDHRRKPAPSSPGPLFEWLFYPGAATPLWPSLSSVNRHDRLSAKLALSTRYRIAFFSSSSSSLPVYRLLSNQNSRPDVVVAKRLHEIHLGWRRAATPCRPARCRERLRYNIFFLQIPAVPRLFPLPFASHPNASGRNLLTTFQTHRVAIVCCFDLRFDHRGFLRETSSLFEDFLLEFTLEHAAFVRLARK